MINDARITRLACSKWNDPLSHIPFGLSRADIYPHNVQIMVIAALTLHKEYLAMATVQTRLSVYTVRALRRL